LVILSCPLLPKNEEYIMRQFKIVVEKHPDGYVAYPLGLKGVVVGQGDSYEEALSDVNSAIRFHIETFGKEVLEVEPQIIEAFVAETGVEV
jgi:predicted RNase H-like HicB family nuclease